MRLRDLNVNTSDPRVDQRVNVNTSDPRVDPNVTPDTEKLVKVRASLKVDQEAEDGLISAVTGLNDSEKAQMVVCIISANPDQDNTVKSFLNRTILLRKIT